MPGIAWSCHELRRGEEGFFPGACRGSTALPTPGLQTSGLQNWENRFLPFVETCYGRPGKLIQLCSLKPFHRSLPAIRNISFCPPRPATLSPQPTYPASFPLPILQPNTMPLCHCVRTDPECPSFRPSVPVLPSAPRPQSIEKEVKVQGHPETRPGPYGCGLHGTSLLSTAASLGGHLGWTNLISYLGPGERYAPHSPAVRAARGSGSSL